MQNIVIIALAVGVFVALWYFKRPDITSQEAQRLVAGGASLVDVRSPSEFAAGHLTGARNIPVGEITGRSAELGSKERPVVLYCASGTRSAAAARSLRSAGFSKVYNLGAMSNWR